MKQKHCCLTVAVDGFVIIIIIYVGRLRQPSWINLSATAVVDKAAPRPFRKYLHTSIRTEREDNITYDDGPEHLSLWAAVADEAAAKEKDEEAE